MFELEMASIPRARTSKFPGPTEFIDRVRLHVVVVTAIVFARLI